MKINTENVTPSHELRVAAINKYEKEIDNPTVKVITAFLSLTKRIGKYRKGSRNESKGVARFLFTKVEAGKAVCWKRLPSKP